MIKYISSVATAIGTMLIMTIGLVVGAQNVNAKHHVSKFVKIINFRVYGNRIKEINRGSKT